MAEMLEKVARAVGEICNEKGQELASKCGAQAPPIPWQAFKREAKAAISAYEAALKAEGPTQAMIDRGSRARVAARHKMPHALTQEEYAAPDIMKEDRLGMREAWQAMLAALEVNDAD